MCDVNIKMEEFLNSSLLETLYEARQDEFITLCIRKETDYNRNNGITTENIDEEQEIINLLVKYVKNEQQISEIRQKIYDFEKFLYDSAEKDFRRIYKLGFADGYSLKKELKEVISEHNSFLNENDKSFNQYFEDFRFKFLYNREDYKEIRKQKREILDKYPRIRDLLENKNAKGLSDEEHDALNEVLRLDSSKNNLELLEAYKLGMKENN